MTAQPGDGMPARPVGRGHLRASHADREHVIAMLKAAFVQGRLTKDEFDVRVGQTLTARTYADLAGLTADLPPGLIAALPPCKPARPPRNKAAKPGVVRMTIAVAASIPLAAVASPTLTLSTFTSSALVMLGPHVSSSMAAQVAIAESDPVLRDALPSVKPTISLHTLRSDIQVTSRTQTVIEISDQGETAVQAERTADAVADSYVTYVSSGTPPSGRVQAPILEPAGTATETSRPIPLLVPGGLTALLGGLIGALSALAFSRRGRRFRMR